MHMHKRGGFSLIELSIVLVILGLLTGGILAGQSLIRASELRAVSTEYQRYATAISSFRDKYFAIPGDMANATSFGTTWIGNGGGNGQINNTAAATTNEPSLFWIHLASAALVEGSYTNIANTTFTSGTNNPRSKISNGAWNVAGLGSVVDAGTASYTNATAPAAATFYTSNYGNVLLLGSGTNALLPGGILKSEEAWNIDTKMDDGRPDQGSVLTLESQGNSSAGSGCGNITGNTAALAASNYDLTNASQTACALVFKTGY